MAKSNQVGKVTILLSGGMDSTSLIHFYKNMGAKVNCLFIDFGQPAAHAELKAVKKVSTYYKVNFDVVQLKTSKKFKEGVVIGRNLFFLSTALLNTNQKSGIIAIGAHKGTDYIDCNKPFYDSVNVIFSQYSNGKIVVATPFIDLTKNEIFHFCLEEGVPLELTYSCEKGEMPACGKCNTCKEIKELYARKVNKNRSPSRKPS